MKGHLPIMIKYLPIENNKLSDYMRLYWKEAIHSSNYMSQLPNVDMRPYLNSWAQCDDFTSKDGVKLGNQLPSVSNLSSGIDGKWSLLSFHHSQRPFFTKIIKLKQKIKSDKHQTINYIQSYFVKESNKI